MTSIILFDTENRNINNNDDANDTQLKIRRQLGLRPLTSYSSKSLSFGTRIINDIDYNDDGHKNSFKITNENIVNGEDIDDYSRGLKLNQFQPGQYALEVVTSHERGGGGNGSGSGTIRVDNPFNKDRLVYLSYMTTSAIAAANKVYPRIKVRIIEQRKQQEGLAQGPTTRSSQQQQQQLLLSSLSMSSSVILDPSHDDNNDDKHRIRTTAVGFIPAQSMGIIELTPLEVYTVQNFRIVGVSFLAVENDNDGR